MSEIKRDVFVCHASEDKDEVVRPLVEACNQAQISCWYDEAEIAWGDSITQKINEGLTKSRYAIVVLSAASVGKNWPQRELNAVLNLEARSGDVIVLPLLVGCEKERNEIIAKYPLLNDKKYETWDGSGVNVVAALKVRLKRTESDAPSDVLESQREQRFKIPLPTVKKRFTQRDKDLFVRNSFTVVRGYFEEGLSALKQQDSDVQSDLFDIHALKFTSTIYVRGEVESRCKIWLGGGHSGESILFHVGNFDLGSDNSYSESLAVGQNDQFLGFEQTSMLFGARSYEADNLLTAEETAEYLWSRFVEPINQ